MKKVRKVRRYGVMTDTLRAQASNFILDWILALTGSKWSVLSSDVAEDYLDSMILYELKFIQFVRDQHHC